MLEFFKNIKTKEAVRAFKITDAVIKDHRGKPLTELLKTLYIDIKEGQSRLWFDVKIDDTLLNFYVIKYKDSSISILSCENFEFSYGYDHSKD